MVKNGIDAVSVEGAANLPYAIPNMRVDLHTPKDIGVPVLWWRSVGSSHTAYSTEVFLDQVARAGKDPVACASNCWPSIRGTAACSARRREGRLGQAAAAGRRARGAGAAWRCMSPSTATWRRWPR
jgi:isoquinoline 1-oxidoreductase beta subunit